MDKEEAENKSESNGSVTAGAGSVLTFFATNPKKVQD